MEVAAERGIAQIRLSTREMTTMLNLEPAELRNTWRTALASAELLRREGEMAKAARVESLARIVERELARRGEAIDH